MLNPSLQWLQLRWHGNVKTSYPIRSQCILSLPLENIRKPQGFEILRIWSYSMKKSLIENFIFCAVTVFPVDMFHSFTLPGNLWCWSVLYSNTLLKRFLDILKELTKMDIFKSVSLWLKRLCELVTHILPFIVKWKQTGFEGKFD